MSLHGTPSRSEPETIEFSVQPPTRKRSGLALVLFLLLVVGVVALGLSLFNTVFGGSQQTPIASVQSPAVSESSAPESIPLSASVVPETAVEVAEDLDLCLSSQSWHIYRGSVETSCGFAEAVGRAMAPMASSSLAQEIRATSPVTGQDYDMRCEPEDESSFICRGGDNAVVVLERVSGIDS
ncbi:hypothetical protein [Corynebacterium alimapuense]|uniref:hypothetical protein n=1 Tax=Corynebacterium alimapuense TaxID=1576874 RepID=UPI001401C8DC|nr:hypothetical protein [Corynebacterium alimapuense]